MKSNLLYAYDKVFTTNTSEIQTGDIHKFVGSIAFLIEEICNSEPEELKSLLINEIDKDFFMPPPWLRVLIIRNIICKTPNDIDFFKWAINNLIYFYDPQTPIILELENKCVSK